MSTHKCQYDGCDRPIYQNPNFPTRKCIFHCEEKDPQEFRNALARQIREWRSAKAKKWDFSGWMFVDIERKREYEWQRSNLFRKAMFPADAVFENAVFVGTASLDHATFLGSANFTEVRFTGFANFFKCGFAGITSFEHTTFKESAHFRCAVFDTELNRRPGIRMGVVFFNRAAFLKDAVFKYAQFSVFASFEHTVFSGSGDFDAAILEANMNLSYASFGTLGSFSKIIVKNIVKLTWPGSGRIREMEGKERQPGKLSIEDVVFQESNPNRRAIIDLRDNDLGGGARLAIRNTKMGRLLLSGTDCRLIEWSNSSAYDFGRRNPSTRRKLADEYYLINDPTVFGKDRPQWDSVAVAYQQLTDRFRKDLNHPVANDFERGIFEARYMAAKQDWKTDWRSVILLSFYKGLSNFGGSIWRPAWICGLILLLWSVFYGAIIYKGEWGWPMDWSLALDSAVASLRVVSLDRHWFSVAVRRACY